MKAYLKSLPFNGEFTPMAMEDAIQKVTGVKNVLITASSAKYGLLPFTPTGARYIPDAGWMRITDDADVIINYIPYTPNE